MIKIGLPHKELEKYASLSSRLHNAILVDESEPCDAIIISLESPWNEAYICQAIEAGKHILIELPTIQSSVDWKAMIQSCHEADVRLMAGNAKRFLPSIQSVKEALDSGNLGELGLLRIHSWNINNRESILSQLVCEIDLALWLFGKAPTEIYAVGNEEQHYIQVHLGFSKGGMALIDSAVLPSGSPYYSLSVIGSTGAAYADDHHNMQLLYQPNDPSALKTTQGNSHQLTQIQAFVDALIEDVEPPITGNEAYLALQITESAIE